MRRFALLLFWRLRLLTDVLGMISFSLRVRMIFFPELRLLSASSRITFLFRVFFRTLKISLTASVVRTSLLREHLRSLLGILF